eukprot:ANDGO_08249.mRNA.1 hypothetical protein
MNEVFRQQIRDLERSREELSKSTRKLTVQFNEKTRQMMHEKEQQRHLLDSLIHVLHPDPGAGAGTGASDMKRSPAKAKSAESSDNQINRELSRILSHELETRLCDKSHPSPLSSSPTPSSQKDRDERVETGNTHVANGMDVQNEAKLLDTSRRKAMTPRGNTASKDGGFLLKPSGYKWETLHVSSNVTGVQRPKAADVVAAASNPSGTADNARAAVVPMKREGKGDEDGKHGMTVDGYPGVSHHEFMQMLRKAKALVEENRRRSALSSSQKRPMKQVCIHRVDRVDSGLLPMAQIADILQYVTEVRNKRRRWKDPTFVQSLEKSFRSHAVASGVARNETVEKDVEFGVHLARIAAHELVEEMLDEVAEDVIETEALRIAETMASTATCE